MRSLRHLLPLLVFAVAVVVSAGSLSAASVSCAPSTIDCSPCCPGCSACTDNRPCILGTFTAINHPSSGDRTGFTVCGSDSDSKTVIFQADGKSASLSVSGFQCISKHLDELSWSGGQPELHTLESVSFSVDGPYVGENAVSMVTAITFTGTHYNLHRLDSCVGPIFEPPDPCPGKVC